MASLILAGSQPGFGQQKPGQQDPLKKQDPPKKAPLKKQGDDKPEAPVDRNALPPGFQPRGDDLPQFTTEEEWQGVAVPSKVMFVKYNELRRTREPLTKNDQDLIVSIVRYKLAALSLKKNRASVHDLREKFTNELRLTTSQETRDFILETVVKEAPKLFTLHFAARLNGAILLAELNKAEENISQGIPAVAYIPAGVPLLAVFRDKTNQLEAVRLWAARGLARITNVSDIKVGQKNEIVAALVKELDASAKDQANEWYQVAVAESLGTLNTLDAGDRTKPVVVQSLVQLLADPQRPCIARAEAAFSLGRLPLDKQINVALIASEIARLTQQVGLGYQKTPTDPQWVQCSVKIYTSFQPLTANRGDDRGLRKKNLGSNKKFVDQAYHVSVPVIRDIIKGVPAAAAEDAAKIDAWIKQNPLQNNLVAPGLPQIQIKPGAAQAVKKLAQPPAEKPPVSGQSENKPAQEETASSR